MFPELDEIRYLAEASLGTAFLPAPHVRASVIETVAHGGERYPIHAFSFGTADPAAPVLGIVGGVHGLERIGSWVAIALLKHVLARLEWDAMMHEQLKRMRMFFVPLVNPVGMMNRTRGNGNGVDLMRNAPLDSPEPTWMAGGQRISPRLPWYRGSVGRMEAESLAVTRFSREQIGCSPCSIVIDLHSGFGWVDQIWFPYAHTRAEFPHLAETRALKTLMDRVLPHHVYRFEAQSRHYRTHGDLWDDLYLRLSGEHPERLFLPLTVEMGSWSWVKKNPFQIFSALGPFNPVKPHRHKRALRRHLPLFDFLCSALISNAPWSRLSAEERERHLRAARALQYRL